MTSLVLQPDATDGVDTQMYSNNVTGNYGVAVVISAGSNSPATRIQRALIKFDVSSIPAGATINSATLTLYCSAEAITTDITVGVHRALTQWFEGLSAGVTPGAGENASTWNLRNHNGSVGWGGGTPGGLSATDYAATPTASTSITGTGTTFTWDVLADVAAWVAGTATNYGWWLKSAGEATVNSRKDFVSSDGATPSQRPQLSVDYTVAGGDTVARTIEIGGQFGMQMLPTGGAGMIMIN